MILLLAGLNSQEIAASTQPPLFLVKASRYIPVKTTLGIGLGVIGACVYYKNVLTKEMHSKAKILLDAQFLRKPKNPDVSVAIKELKELKTVAIRLEHTIKQGNDAHLKSMLQDTQNFQSITNSLVQMVGQAPKNSSEADAYERMLEFAIRAEGYMAEYLNASSDDACKKLHLKKCEEELDELRNECNQAISCLEMHSYSDEAIERQQQYEKELQEYQQKPKELRALVQHPQIRSQAIGQLKQLLCYKKWLSNVFFPTGFFLVALAGMSKYFNR